MACATTLFCVLFRSSASLVRRFSAERLGLSASLGVTEDAHTLQSSILHSRRARAGKHSSEYGTTEDAVHRVVLHEYRIHDNVWIHPAYIAEGGKGDGAG